MCYSQKIKFTNFNSSRKESIVLQIKLQRWMKANGKSPNSKQWSQIVKHFTALAGTFQRKYERQCCATKDSFAPQKALEIKVS
jgi:hypothetical protein